MIAGPGSTIITMPIASTVEPTIMTAIRFTHLMSTALLFSCDLALQVRPQIVGNA
jgi:hypothetical protein